MKADELLVLHYESLSQRAESLFQDLNKSLALRELFLKDPTSVVVERILGRDQKPSETRINQVNRLLFSLLSNTKFMEWSRQFQEKMEAQLQEIAQSEDPIEAMKLLLVRLNRAKLYQEIAEAALQFSDVETLYSLFALSSTRASFSAAEIRGLVEPIEAATEEAGNVFPIPVTALAILVLVVLVLIPGVTNEPTPLKLSRQDLLRISAFLSQQLTARAQEVRQTGKLTSFEPL